MAAAVKLPWYRLTLAELIAEARRAIGTARTMRDALVIDRASDNVFAEADHLRAYENAVHNAGFFRDEWKRARRLGVVLSRKPSGLALLRLACGCEVWIRRMLDGTVHRGRQGHACGAFGLCGSRETENLNARIDAAAVALLGDGQ